MYRRAPVLVLLLLLQGIAAAQIELRSSKEVTEPRLTTITLAIKHPNQNIETEMTLRYPGSAKKMVQNGKERLMLANQQATIVAFNFRAGTEANDSIALALFPSGKLVYFFELNHVIVELIAKWKKNLDDASFMVTDVTDESLVLDYYQHYVGLENLNFRVVAHVQADGNLKVGSEDIKELPQ